MPGAFDANLMFRTTATLTQDETCGPLQVWGGKGDQLAARVIIPAAYGTNDTVLPEVWGSTSSGGTFSLIAKYGKGAQKPGTGSLEMVVPFALPYNGCNWIKLVLDVTVASTTPNFGTAIAGIIRNPGRDWSRSTSFA